MHPSAMMYYEMANKFVERTGTLAGTQEERLKLSRMEGLLSSEKDDLYANDSTVGTEDGQTMKSSIIPYGLKSGGDIDAYTNAISLKDMNTVLEYAKYSAAETAKHIIDGDFNCSPARLGNIDACKFCSFKSVCNFNENEEGFQVRNLEKLGKKEEVIELMKEALGIKE